MLQFNEDRIHNDSVWYTHGSSKARLVNCTPHIDETCGYVARVSSKDQENPSVAGLLRYCAKHGHWSVFEQGSVTVEIVTPLAIAIQLLRHRFCFQQFSGRYQDQKVMGEMVDGLPAFHSMFYIPEEAREQDTKNRQNSIFTDNEFLTDKMWQEMELSYNISLRSYDRLLEMGVAKEIARFVLPQGVYTKLFVTGNPRSFIHYCNVRGEEGVVQYEHVELARVIKEAFSEACPVIARSTMDENS